MNESILLMVVILVGSVARERPGLRLDHLSQLLAGRSGDLEQVE